MSLLQCLLEAVTSVVCAVDPVPVLPEKLRHQLAQFDIIVYQKNRAFAARWRGIR